MITMEWACQHCGAANEDPACAELDSVACEDCGRAWDLRPVEGHLEDGRVERCRFCGSGKLFVQKAFNRTLGITIVAVGALLAMALGVWVHPFLFGAVLFAFVVVDFALYALLPVVDVCYRCRSVYHGSAPVEGREGFDLDTAEWNERQFTLERDHRLAREAEEPAGDRIGP